MNGNGVSFSILMKRNSDAVTEPTAEHLNIFRIDSYTFESSMFPVV